MTNVNSIFWSVVEFFLVRIFVDLQQAYIRLKLHWFDLLWICCGFFVQLVEQEIHNRSNQWSFSLSNHKTDIQTGGLNQTEWRNVHVTATHLLKHGVLRWSTWLTGVNVAPYLDNGTGEQRWLQRLRRLGLSRLEFQHVMVTSTATRVGR